MIHFGLECDIENVLQRRDCGEDMDIFHRLSTFCQDFQSRVAASIETFIVREREYSEKYKRVSELIARSHLTNKEKEAEVDNIVLQQKVTDKKISIAMKQQTKIRDEIAEAKQRKESIALQMVDLSQEMEVSRKRRKDRWNAIKMACTYYKENLDFYIDLTQLNDHDSVKVTFFRQKNPMMDSYYVNLKNYKSSWRVGHIEPALKEKHANEIKGTIDFTKSLNNHEIVAFLCKLKNVFSKHYIKE